jgi:sulfite exporter TauE/SafE
MFALATAVLIASLLGSLHCAGMCGPFVAFAVNDSDGASKTGLQVAYHVGRLTTYMLLGAAAGATGALVDLTTTLAGLQPLAMGLAGGLMVLFGALELARVAGLRLEHTRPPRWLTKTVQAGQRFALTLPSTRRALVIGLLTTLLPCGWLYAFAITAAGTGHPLSGAILMAVFWVGTLPVLIALGVGVQTALGALGTRLPALCAIMLIAVGLWTLTGRAALDPSTLAHAAGTASSGASDAAVPDPTELPPCCREKLEADKSVATEEAAP